MASYLSEIVSGGPVHVAAGPPHLDVVFVELELTLLRNYGLGLGVEL